MKNPLIQSLCRSPINDEPYRTLAEKFRLYKKIPYYASWTEAEREEFEQHMDPLRTMIALDMVEDYDFETKTVTKKATVHS